MREGETTALATGLPTATIADLLSWEPCWPEAKIRALAGDRDSFNALDVLILDTVPIADRLWVVLRPELIDERTLRLWACWCVRHTPLADGRTTWDLLDDTRSRTAVEVAERFAVGEATAEELAAARAAAWAAAWAAARDAAWAAARAAAWAAARDAARNAAWAAAGAAARDAARNAAGAAAGDAAGDAARAAAWAAAGDAAGAAQIRQLKAMLAALVPNPSEV